MRETPSSDWPAACRHTTTTVNRSLEGRVTARLRRSLSHLWLVDWAVDWSEGIVRRLPSAASCSRRSIPCPASRACTRGRQASSAMLQCRQSRDRPWLHTPSPCRRSWRTRKEMSLRPCPQRYRWHLEKNATQMPAISWRLTRRAGSSGRLAAAGRSPQQSRRRNRRWLCRP